jgi:hypothetical protein
LLKPPHGRVTAIDLNKGERLWMTADATARGIVPLRTAARPADAAPGEPLRRSEAGGVALEIYCAGGAGAGSADV